MVIRGLNAPYKYCKKCGGEGIIWTKDKYGFSHAEYCDECNKNGHAIQIPRENEKPISKF